MVPSTQGQVSRARITVPDSESVSISLKTQGGEHREDEISTEKYGLWARVWKNIKINQRSPTSRVGRTKSHIEGITSNHS